MPTNKKGWGAKKGTPGREKSPAPVVSNTKQKKTQKKKKNKKKKKKKKQPRRQKTKTGPGLRKVPKNLGESPKGTTGKKHLHQDH